MNPLIAKAAEFAREKHKDQKRKYTGEPYFVHCEAVALLVQSVTDDPEMIASAYLHDVAEDCGVTYPELCNAFGVPVADLVGWLTDRSKPSDGNRAARKKIDREILAKAPARAKTIKLADLIDNTKSIVEHDKDFAKVYLAEKELLLPLLVEGNAVLFHEAERTLKEGIIAINLGKESNERRNTK